MKAFDLIAVAVQTPTETIGDHKQYGIPLLVMDEPGTGKSSVMADIAKLLGAYLEVIIGSTMDPTDVSGLPSAAGDYVKFLAPAWAHRLIEHAKGHEGDGVSGFLFIDEISTCPPSVQAALLRVIHERMVGDKRLPTSIAMVAAANPAECAAGGWELAAPLANRMAHVTFKGLDVEDWAEGMASGSFSQKRVPIVKEDLWAEKYESLRILVSAFLRVNSGMLHAMPSDAAKQSGPWPSRRSWVMAARFAAGVQAAGFKGDYEADLFLEAFTACVGPGAAGEFAAWLRSADLPDPEDVLADPGSESVCSLDFSRSDRVYATVMNVSIAATKEFPEKKRLARWEAAWTFLERVAKGAPDIACSGARHLSRNAPRGAKAPTSVKVLVPILKEAGILSA